MVGAFRRIQHHVVNEKKRRANVVIVADPTKGPNDGFLSLRVCSPTKNGIASESPVIANFGATFHPDKALPFSLDATPSKNFKSALELLFDEQMKSACAEGNGDNAEIVVDDKSDGLEQREAYYRGSLHI
jgi:hypothetical protein